MTIQVAVANCYGLAMASDRHVYRHGEARSTGQDVKLLRIRGSVPAALMASGPFVIAGLPVSRLALRLEKSLAAASGEEAPEELAALVLRTLDQPLDHAASSGLPEADAAILAEVAEEIVDEALAGELSCRAGLETLVAEVEQAPRCHDGESIEALGRSVWQERFSALPRLVSKPHVAEALRQAPELCGRAIVGALSRDWRKASDLFLTVGLCCPGTGVPVLISLRLWRGIGNRLLFASRLEGDYEAVWKSSRTVLIAQGSGRALIEAMVDGLAEDHWERLQPADHEAVRPAMRGRWDRAHDRVSVSSPRELAACAAGLVRGAEVIGYLTRDSEGSVADVDCLLLTPWGVQEYSLHAGPELRQAA